MSRPNWHEYFLKIAKVAASRTTYNRGIKKGCVVVKDNHVLVTGYAGSPPGTPHCNESGHIMIAGHCLRTVHAERNALNCAARYGISIDEATIYITEAPCYYCAKDIVTVGINTIIISKNTHHSDEKWQIEARDILFCQSNVCYWLYENGELKNLL